MGFPYTIKYRRNRNNLKEIVRMKWIESLIVACSMYSKIPMPQIEWNKDNMRYALCYFPAVGAAIGILMFVWSTFGRLLPIGNILFTAILILIPVIVSGGIHLDGLLDTADALSSWQTMERRLEILKDSHAGAFAIIICCVYFVADFGIWSEAGILSVKVLAIGFALSRALNGFGIAAFPCAKNSGLAATFADGADKKKCRIVLLTEACVCVVLMLLISVPLGIAAAAAAFVTLLLYRRMAMKRFGGITGDTQGFFTQICELVMAFAVILTQSCALG